MSKNKCKVGLFPPTGRGNRKTCDSGRTRLCFQSHRYISVFKCLGLTARRGRCWAPPAQLMGGFLTPGLSLGTLLVRKPMSLRPFGWLGQVRFLCLTSTGMCLVLIFCGRLGQPQGVVAVQLLKPCLLASPWTAAHQASLSSTISWSLLKFTSIESMMPSNHLILCHPLLPPPSIFPSIRVFSNELALRIRWPKYWSFSYNISPSNGYSRLMSFRTDWFDLFAVQGTLKSLLQHHSSKTSVLQCSASFMVQLSHPYMTTGKTRALTWAAGCVKSAVRLKFLLFQ